ncbi:hypothetical protein LTS00_013427 [Friedmanniomyces endolithicus]|nr:hypothetical protein LTS00_013427 [Friedmanniomyces endolithicus]
MASGVRSAPKELLASVRDLGSAAGSGDPEKEAVVVNGIEVESLPFATAADGTQDPSRRVLTEEKGYKHLGFAFSERRKWLVLTSIFVRYTPNTPDEIVQISMNFNAAIYANAVPGMKTTFGISASKARLGQFIFLVMYAFGCELWAPWSEELGRYCVLQWSLGLVNLWQIPCALAPSFWMVFAFRALGGLSSAGGSVTLGMVADMWEPADQQYAVAFVVLSSVAGSVVAPIAGGFITQYLAWTWVFWISLIFGVVAQVIHAFAPETRASAMLAKQAKLLRKQGYEVYAEQELAGSFRKRIDFKEAFKLMWRPYQFLLTEPIVGFLSLLSGFSDALIFVGLESFGLVLAKWNFDDVQVGLAFIGLMVGYVIAYALYMWDYKKQRAIMQGDTANMAPERRLRLLLWLVALEAHRSFRFRMDELGPTCRALDRSGIANFAIYMATIDYMVAAYGPYSASATGGNGFCRDFLAGIAALYATPFYTSIAKGTRWQLTVPSLILSAIALVGTLPVYYFYVRGEDARNKSKYAKQLADARAEKRDERQEAITRASSRNTTPAQSRRTTPTTSRRGSLEVAPMVYQRSLAGKARGYETPTRAGSVKGMATVSESAEMARRESAA